MLLIAIHAEHEPTTYSEAVKYARWREAMQREIQALETNGTWVIEDKPTNKKALGCKWVYKIKYNSDGTMERYKAWLVILGNHQVEGIDYIETFAPVAKNTCISSSCSDEKLGSASNGRPQWFSLWRSSRRSFHEVASWVSHFGPRKSMPVEKVSLWA